MVVILMAFGVSAFTGFEQNLDIAVGESVEVGHGTGLRAQRYRILPDEVGKGLGAILAGKDLIAGPGGFGHAHFRIRGFG